MWFEIPAIQKYLPEFWSWDVWHSMVAFGRILKINQFGYSGDLVKSLGSLDLYSSQKIGYVM